jgi:hypothetical protein
MTGAGGPPPTSPTPATAAPGAVAQVTFPGYPSHLPHPISWSDLHHICHGDPDDERRGGHLHGTGRPNKTEFPPDWDDEKGLP